MDFYLALAIVGSLGTFRLVFSNDHFLLHWFSHHKALWYAKLKSLFAMFITKFKQSTFDNFFFPWMNVIVVLQDKNQPCLTTVIQTRTFGRFVTLKQK